MSDRRTSIGLSNHTEIADFGRKTRNEMIAQYRRWAQQQLEEAQAILNADDDEFIVETYIGLYSRKKVERIDR